MDSAQPLQRRTLVGHPVDVATGIVFTAWDDFAIPGPFPLVWRRFYNTSWLEDGPFGKGWVTPFSVRLRRVGNRLVFLNDDAAEVVLDVPRDGQRINHPPVHLEALRRGEHYVVWDWHHDERFVFEARGADFRLVRVENLAGHGIDLDYSDERWTGLTDSGGRSFRLESNARGLVERVALAPGSAAEATLALARYEYDRQGRLVAAYDRADRAIHYEYDDRHRLIKETNRLGGSFHFRYDGQGRCVFNAGDGGFLERRLDYDAARRTTTVTDGLGHRSVYEHNEAGLVTSITNPLGAVRRKLYDLNGFLILEFDPAGGGTQYEYDGAGHMVGVTDPMGMTSRYEYDQDHKLIGHTNPNAQAFRWVRDERGRVRTALAPGGGRTEYRYDPDGQLVATTDALGNTTRFLLDGRNLVSEVAGPDGSTARYHYNALGQLTAQVDALGHETRYGFDERGSWDLEVRPDGSSSRFRNDADGHVVAAEDREGSTTRYQWDAFHRLIARTDALGHRVTCAYDSEGRIRAVTNERGESARFEYDAAGRLVRWDGFDGRVQRYHYDARDLLVRRHDGAGVEVEFVRDKAGRVVLRRGCDGDTARFAYDAGGRLVRCENAAGAVELTYGPSGQVVEEKQGDVILRRDYDAAGQRIALSIEDFLDYQYEYDANLRLTALHAGRLGHGFAWDPAGRLAAQEHANGATSRYEYDAADRLIGHTVRSPFGRELARFSYRFDRNDQLVEAAETGRGAAAYTYNRRGELTARAGPACAEDYAYDPAGNLVAGPGAALTCGPGNRLLAAGEARFEFDDRGNVVARRDAAGMTAYRYNSENLLTAVVHPDGTETTYAYDPLGRRIRKTHRGQDVHFLWDQDVPLIERAGERVTRYAFFPGSFLPLSMSDGEGDYDFLLNHLGTPTRLLDGHGQVAWSARSTAFGAPVAAEGPVRNPFRFQGQYRDDESGLHYNRWRYYDPGAGRYTTQDPLFVGERENLYRYALNPVNWIDPYGLTCGGKTYETPEDVAAALNRGERNMHASSHEVAQQGANIWLGGSGERITVADRPKSYRSAPKPEEVIGYGRGNRRVSKDGTVIYDRMVLNGRPHSKADFGTDPHGPHIKVEHIPNDQASHIYYP